MKHEGVFTRRVNIKHGTKHGEPWGLNYEFMGSLWDILMNLAEDGNRTNEGHLASETGVYFFMCNLVAVSKHRDLRIVNT